MRRPLLAFCLALATIWLAGILIARHRSRQLPPSSASPGAAPSSSTASLLASSTAPSAAEASTTPPGATTITWQPSSLVVTLSPGETKTLTATATITSLVPASTVRSDYSLSPYVTVTPSQLPALPKGGQQTFTLSVNVPATTTPQTLGGVVQVHLRSGDTLALNTLPITVNVWPLFRTGILSFNYPPTITALGGAIGDPLVISKPPGATWIEIPLAAGSSATPQSTFGILVESNPTNLTLQQWFAANVDDSSATLTTAGTYRTQALPDGRMVLVASGPVPATYIDENGPESLPFAYTALLGSPNIASIILSQDNDLDRLGYTTLGQKDDVMLQILETFRFTP